MLRNLKKYFLGKKKKEEKKKRKKKLTFLIHFLMKNVKTF